MTLDTTYDDHYPTLHGHAAIAPAIAAFHEASGAKRDTALALARRLGEEAR